MRMDRSHQKLSILLLAAGQSKRMGDTNKLLMPYGKVPLVRHTAQQILTAKLGEITVVTGFEADAVGQSLSGLDLKFCHNPNFKEGQMSSVRAGSQAIPFNSEGLLIALSDMPKLNVADYQFLYDQFHAYQAQKIIIPYFGHERGNPIIIPRHMISKITFGGSNFGCRKLVQTNPEKVLKVTVDRSTFVWDIDTPGDYSRSVGSVMHAAPCC